VTPLLDRSSQRRQADGMPKRSTRSRDRDTNEIAARIIAQVSGEASHPMERRPTKEQVSAVAAELGRRGGLKGGKARAKKLSAAKRTAIAKKAAKARWQGGS
jgi:hypothetical protein